MTTIDTSRLVYPGSSRDRDADSPAAGTRWAWAGVGAAVSAITAVVGSMNAGAVYDPDLAGDALGLTEKLADQTAAILVFHTAALVSMVLLVPFTAGLHRHLSARVPAVSLLPGAAAIGLVLVMTSQLMGTALDTEFVFGIQDPDLLVPETAVLWGHWINTVPWLWVGAGVTALSVGIAGRRYGAVAGWLTWTSLVVGGLTLLVGVSPLQYMAGMSGPVWLLVAAIGLVVAARRSTSEA